MRLGEIADRFPGVPRIALTATAAPATQKDIAKRLGLEEAPWFCSSFDRSNIRYEIVEKTSRRTQLLSFLERHRGRSEEHTSELQSLMRISYAVFCLKKNKHTTK